MSATTQVTERNNGEHRTYFAGEHKLTPETVEAVYVAWPDGLISVCPVEWVEERHTYSDHGANRSVLSDVPYVSTEANGVAVRIKLSRLEIVI